MHNSAVTSTVVFLNKDDLNFFFEFATINDFEFANDFEVDENVTATRIAPLIVDMSLEF